MSKKYGSFNVTIKCIDNEPQKHTVNPLSQQELGNGWRLVVPKKRNRIVTVKSDSGENIKIRKTNESFFKINLAQLPPYLFNNLKTIYKKDENVSYRARDRSYVYLVQSTPVDQEIRKLFNYCNKYENCVNNLNNEQITEIKECLQKLDDEEINGWVVSKSKRLFEHL